MPPPRDAIHLPMDMHSRSIPPEADHLPPSVLVVDDNAADRDLHCLVLRAMGMRAVGVSTGWEALVCARTLVPDLVLTEVRMPGLDGPGLVDRLRADPRTAAIPVLLVTGADDVERETGAAVLLRKPIDRARLQAAVASALARVDG